MAKYQPKPYQKLSKITGRFEWVYPEPVEYRKERNRGGKIKLIKKP